MIKFGDWLPDQPDMGGAGVINAENVIPSINGYRSVNSFTSFSNAGTNILKGIFATKDNNGSVNLFAGDQGKLYKFNPATSNLDDVTRSSGGAYSLTSDKERWRFVQFGTSVIASGGAGENLQEFTLGTDSQFADLTGSPPKAEFLAVIGDQVWTANIDEGSGVIPFRTRWSALNDATSWTVGTNQADFQDIPDAGAITGLVGGTYGTILMEKAILRASYVGTPLIYQIDKVETTKGCTFSGSVANIGNLIFYLNEDGFFAFDGRQSTPIGMEKVNKFFFNDVSIGHIDKISCAIDPQNQVVAWSYVSTQSGSTTPNKILFYNYSLKKWSIAEVENDLIAPFFTAGFTLDDLDNLASNMDSLTGTLDSNTFKGGTLLFGGSKDNKIFAFNGSPLTGTIETQEFSITKGKHSIVTKTVPYFKGGDVSIAVGTRNRQSDDVTFTSGSSLNVDGFTQHRDQGRFHRVKMTISGNWNIAQGVDIEGQQLGTR